MEQQINSDQAALGAPHERGLVSLSSDLLWGVDAIAAELNLSRRQAYYQLESGHLPARKQRGKWVASRSGLRRFFASVLSGEVA